MSADTPPHPLARSSVLLCGASGGIGSALARELHNRGAILTLAARDPERLAGLEVPGARIAADLRAAGACDGAVEHAVTHAERLDVLINAVGVVAFGSPAELSVEATEDLLRTNALVPMMLARRALAVLPRRGAIVNISGAIAERNLPGMAAYGASKAAVRAFDQGLARETRRAGIRVIDARPPHTDTGLHLHPIAGEPPALADGLSPERVARVICDALEQGVSDLPASAF